MFTEHRSHQDRRWIEIGPPKGTGERRFLADRRGLHAHAHLHVEELERVHEEYFPGIQVTTHMKLHY